MNTPATSAGRLLRFEAFEADLHTRELRNQGVRIRLAEQPFSVLALLLARPGEVVTRDDLQKKLWPADTFIDFDRGLNKAINRLRDALGDSADAPRFIETLPKRGYRFVGNLLPPSAPMAAVQPPPQQLALYVWATAGCLVLVAVLAVWWERGRDRPVLAAATPLIRSSLLPPPDRTFVSHSLALSRDGTHLAFVAETGTGLRSLWVRAMAATTANPIAGTDGASLPFWSPDLRQVAFFADRKLKVVDITGGTIRVIADANRPSGGTWNSGGVIVYAPDVNGPLYRVAATGGTPVPVTEVAAGEGLRGHRWPAFLPDDRHFLYVSFSAARPSDNTPELRIGSLDSDESTLVDWDGSRSVAYAVDHLIYVRGGTLYAQPFDSAALRINGPPLPVAGVELAGAPAFFPSALAVSMNGVLVFLSATDLPSRLIWLDQAGREQGAIPEVKFSGPAISPDGRLLAGSCEGARGGTLAICVSDLARGVTSRITEGPNDRYPVWSRDGREIAYSAAGVYRVPADGSLPPQRVSGRGTPTDWSPEGRILSFGSRQGVVSLALSSPETQEVTELGAGAEGQLSPDAAWLAYVGPDGLVIQRFPTSSARVTVAGTGASQPRWSRDGRRLFHIGADKKLMATDFDPVTGKPGATVLVAQTRIVGVSLIGFQYDVGPDGRFIVNALSNEAAPLTLLSGWTSTLQR